MGMPGRDKEPFKVAFKGYGHAVVREMPMKNVADTFWED